MGGFEALHDSVSSKCICCGEALFPPLPVSLLPFPLTSVTTLATAEEDEEAGAERAMAGAGRLLLLLRLQRLRWRLLWRTVRGADDRAPALRCPDGASSASASRDRFAARCAAIAAVSNLSMPWREQGRQRGRDTSR